MNNKPKIGHMGVTPIFKNSKDKNCFLKDWDDSDVMKNVFKKDFLFGSYDTKKFNFQNLIVKFLLDLNIVNSEKLKKIG